MKKLLLLSLLIFLNNSTFAMRMVDKAQSVTRTAFAKNPNLLGKVCEDSNESPDPVATRNNQEQDNKISSNNKYYKIKNLIFFCALMALLYKIVRN